MKKEFFESGTRITYQKAGKNGNSPIVIIPRGIGESEFYDNMKKILSRNFLVYILDLPGSGKSNFSSNDPKSLAKGISIFLSANKIKDPVIIGESFGGNVAIELLSLNYSKKAILIGCGNFFSPLKRVLLKIIFLPVTKIKTLMLPYSRIVTWYSKNILKSYELDLSGRDVSQLELLLDRWQKTIDYRLPSYKLSAHVCYVLGKDRVVSNESLKKIKEMFPNLEIICLNCDHFSYHDELSKDNYSILMKFLGK